MVPDHDPFTQITEHRMGILRMLTNGMSQQEIANQLHIQANTVHQHLKYVYNQLGLGGGVGLRGKAVRAAYLLGLRDAGKWS